MAIGSEIRAQADEVYLPRKLNVKETRVNGNLMVRYEHYADSTIEYWPFPEEDEECRTVVFVNERGEQDSSVYYPCSFEKDTSYPEPVFEEFFDSTGKLIYSTLSDEVGVVRKTTYSYTPNGLVDTITELSPWSYSLFNSRRTDSLSPSSIEIFTYDSLGRKASSSTQAAWMVGRRTEEFHYDDSGRLTKVIENNGHPRSGCVVNGDITRITVVEHKYYPSGLTEKIIRTDYHRDKDGNDKWKSRRVKRYRYVFFK